MHSLDCILEDRTLNYYSIFIHLSVDGSVWNPIENVNVDKNSFENENALVWTWISEISNVEKKKCSTSEET